MSEYFLVFLQMFIPTLVGLVSGYVAIYIKFNVSKDIEKQRKFIEDHYVSKDQLSGAYYTANEINEKFTGNKELKLLLEPMQKSLISIMEKVEKMDESIKKISEGLVEFRAKQKKK